jgi:CBS domain-containing protein
MADQNVVQLDTTLTLAVKNLIKAAPVFVGPDASAGDAARQMQHARIGSVLVSTEPPGIITDRDLRGRVLAAGLGPETPATAIMTRPILTIDSDRLAFSALRVMVEENIHHLPVVEEGRIIGIISSTDLLFHQTNNPVYLRRIIDGLGEGIAGSYASAVGSLAGALFQSGLGALQIAEIVSTLNDALVRRLVRLAEQALGPPPVPYAWVVFGSEGRMEQALLTDQDNALVYADAAGEASSYFSELARRVVDGLIQAGFPSCSGGFMATNWCKPLRDWVGLFTNWIRLPEPAALLDAAIFFDFRAVAGALDLEALEEIIVEARNEKLFIAHMANGALAFRPPLGFFNRLRSKDGKVEIKKSGIAPIVSIARVAALAAGSRERSSLERLRVAAASGRVIDSDSAHSLAEILPLFLRLRLHAQLAALAKQSAPDNNIVLADLSSLDRRHLREAFVLVKEVQDDLRSAWRLDSLS